MTPAAVSRNVAILERNLGVRLFQRTTRKLTLTEVGENVFARIVDSLRSLNSAIDDVTADGREPTGTLRVSMSLDFGLEYIIGLLPEFLHRYPSLKIDWRFDNRQVDLIRERLYAGIGAAIALSPDIVIRPLAPHHIIVAAAPAFLAGRELPTEPAALRHLDGIVVRSPQSGRVRHWTMRHADGREALVALSERIVVSDPAAAVRAALLGMGVTLIAMADAVRLLESGQLVRLLPQWFVDAGAITLYYSSRALLPPKTRVFIDYVVEALEHQGLAECFNANAPSSPGRGGPVPERT